MTMLLKIFKVLLLSAGMLLIFLSQMFYSGGLYKTAIWADSLYRKHQSAPTLSVTTLMTAEAISKNKERIKQETLANAIFIEGGEFTMGPGNCDDYPMLSSCAGAPSYPVKLSNYSLLKFKVTNRDFDTFQADAGSYKNPYSSSHGKAQWEKLHQLGNVPAVMNWKDADAYCQWLGKLTDLPIALPTEAQWEYAARNRGQKIGFMTNDGKIEEGINVPSFDMSMEMSRQKAGFLLPVGQFPASPLGLFDLSGNGQEWVEDWYSAETPTTNGPLLDPQGPPAGYLDNEGPAKVLRPTKRNADNSGYGVTTHDRGFAAISASVSISSPYTARCAINRTQRIESND